MTEREKLVNIMGEAMKPWRFGTVTTRAGVRICNVDLDKLYSALDAADAAGWRFVPPDDGR